MASSAATPALALTSEECKKAAQKAAFLQALKETPTVTSTSKPKLDVGAYGAAPATKPEAPAAAPSSTKATTPPLRSSGVGKKGWRKKNQGFLSTTDADSPSARKTPVTNRNRLEFLADRARLRKLFPVGKKLFK